MLLRFLSMVALTVLLPCAGFAQSLPADCSAAAAPKEPLSVSVGGVKFTPKAVTSIFNRKPTTQDSYAVGAFQARLEK